MRRALFNLSHEHKLSCDMGLLIPVCTQEVLPGDTFIHHASVMARVAPLANPLMHRVELRVHHFYVPNRLLWDEWEGFITGRDDVTVPQITVGASNALVDHMGVDRQWVGDINCLPVRAYNLVWNEFYRDQDLQAERSENDLTIARICWEKDYLTVCRPEPQQGTPQSIPVSIGSAPVSGLYQANAAVSTEIPGATGNYAEKSTGATLAPGALRNIASAAAIPVVANFAASSAAVGIDINEFRRTMALQRIAEARAMFGERYVDYLRFLGVNPSDGRLDRPEYLGGGKQVINFSEVLATAEGAGSNVGDLFGHGIVAARSRRYRKMFEEHGYVLSLMSARPKTIYQDGVPRSFHRVTAMDFWQKELEILPWQEVKTSEVHYSGNTDAVFGYVPRYEEYRMNQSYVSGTFRKGTEEDWHMARKFTTLPTLNGSFVECTPTDRVYQDVNMPELLCTVRNMIMAKRLVGSTAKIGAL